MFDELTNVLQSVDFDDTGVIAIARQTRESSRLELLLDIRADGESFERQAWLLSCEHVRSSQLRSDSVYGIQLLDDHIVLAPYIDECVQLGFHGRVDDAKHAVADLWERHRRLCGAWFRFDEFLNSHLPLVELLETAGGVLATGPSRIVSVYADVIRGHGAEPYIISKRRSLRWIDSAWQAEPDDLQLVWLEPSDYVIGSVFHAHRVSIELLPPVA